MSPTQAIPTAIAQGTGGVSWTNLNNAKVEDGAVAFCGPEGPGGGGGTPNLLNATGFGFAIPSTAAIDGIKLEIKVQTTGGSVAIDQNQISLLINGGATNAVNTPNKGQLWPVTALTWLTYGSATDLWGRAWTPADINNANFGAAMAAFSGTGTATINVDAIRITVYWHTAPAIVPKRYLYKVFNAAGTYLGNLPNVLSEFTIPQDINSAGGSLPIECGVSPDTAMQATSIYTAEDGTTPYTDEAATNNYTTEGVIPIVAQGSSGYDTLIKNGNKIQVWESSYYYPNGKIMFSGKIEHWEAGFGGDGGHDTIQMIAYSDGEDLDQYIARGAPFNYTQDQANTSQNASDSVSSFGGKGAAFNNDGQTFTVGAAVTNVAAITIKLNGTATVTVQLFSSPSSSTPLATSTQNVSVGAATDIQFAFPTPVAVTPGGQYFFGVSVAAGQSILIYYQNTNIYVGGAMYNANYGGGSGGGAYLATAFDLYFKTFSGAGTTTGTYTSQDPTTGMLKPIVDDYVGRGGVINYSTSTVDATGLSLTYTLNTNTILEAIKAILDMSPNGFYWYVDMGTDTLWFKQTSTTADFTITKGVHINDINIVASTENVKNQEYFSGGAVAGVNIYKSAQDAASSAAYGVKLNRDSNNRVTDSTTAQTIANGAIAKFKNEQYQTVVKIIDKTMDTTLLKPGKTVGFNGFGTFIDSLILQIVRVEYHPEYAVLTVGTLPLIMSTDYEQLIRGLLNQQTVANPSAPS